MLIFTGPSDPSVTIVNGYNTIDGYVARFTNINPGADGDMLITVSSDDGRFYANALMLRAVIDTHIVTPIAGLHGSIDPSTPQTVNYGSTTSFTVTPTPGYHTASVTGCGGTWTGTNPYATGSITADCTVTAAFAINTYTVTPSAGANGGIDPSTPQTVNYGSTTSFTVTPATGYHTASVTGCGGTWTGTNPYTTGSITADCTVTATFAINTYTITALAGENGSIVCTPNPVTQGGDSTCEVTPNTGYYVDTVAVDGGPATLINGEYVFYNVTSEHSIQATFVAYNNNAVTILEPNDGEIIPSGSNYTVRWEAPVEAATFKLRLSLDNGLTWKLLAGDITDRSYNWNVPAPLGNKRKCLLKVIGYDDSGRSIGSYATTIQIEVVRTDSPKEGDILISGNGYPITWTTNATQKEIAKVRLYYTKNGGVNWNPICDPFTGKCALEGNPGSFDWTVPTKSRTRTKCKIKVELRDEKGNILATDASDGYFTIQP